MITDATSSTSVAPPIEQRQGVGLALSGGGYRAALFHLGTLRRLDELGVLPKVTTIASVSGGSIVNAFLATRLNPWPTQAQDPNFERFALDLRELTRSNIRTVPSFRWVERAYRRHIGSERLGDLPEGGPSFVFCATDLANGVNWTFGRKPGQGLGRWEAGSYRAGYAPASELSLSRAVAASSSFPPVLGPVPLPIDESDYGPHKGVSASVRLTDGGVYDNLGLEPLWKSHQAILVSDGGATLDSVPYSPWKPWKRLGRYVAVANNQGGSIRKRWLIASYKANRSDERAYGGAYFGIGSEFSGYQTHDPAAYPDELVSEVISEVRTDLDSFSDVEAAVLQNQGYLICDAAMRTWSPDLVDPDPPPPHAPYPDWLDPEAVTRAFADAKSAKRRLPFGRFR